MFRITLKAARVNAGMSQNDVAKILGVQRVTIGNWENGRFPTKDYQKKQLACIYHLDVRRIIFPDEDQ